MASLKRLIRDENGAEVIEYSLILGLIVLLALGAIACLGVKVVARWTSVGTALH